MKYIIIFVLFILSCKTERRNPFNGEFKTIDTSNCVTKLHAEKVDADFSESLYLYIVDSFFVSITDMKDYLLLRYNSDDYKLRYRMLTKGNGRNEAIFVTSNKDYLVDSDVKIWFNSATKKELLLVNLTKSDIEGKVVIDTVVNLKQNSKLIRLDKCGMQDSIIYGTEYLPTRANFSFYSANRDSLYYQFDMYKEECLTDRTLLSGFLKPKKDMSKWVNPMMFFNQVNFGDLNKNKYISVSLSSEPQSIIEVGNTEAHERTEYYTDYWCNDSNILLGYNGVNKRNYCNEIHVFNWDGELKNIFKVEVPFVYFAVDERNHTLFLYGADEFMYKAVYSDSMLQ